MCKAASPLDNEGWKTAVKNNLRSYTMIIVLILVMLVFAFLTDGVNLNSRNFTNLFIQNSYILLLATTMVMVIITGNIDLSVGSVAAFVGALTAMAYNQGAGMTVTFLTAIAAGVCIGAFQGMWVAYFKMPAFIVTLAGMLLFRGLTYIITNVTPIVLKDDGYKRIASGMVNIPALSVNKVHYTPVVVGVAIAAVYVLAELWSRKRNIRNGFSVPSPTALGIKMVLVCVAILGLAQRFATYRGIPVVAVLLGVTVLAMSFIMRNTVLGRFIYAVGGNARSAKLSGINTELVVFVVYCIMGAFAGLSGMVFAGYMNSALPQAGNLFEMDAIAACYIGGASASGGIGTVFGAIIGGLVMGCINNGMSLMNIGSDWQYVVKALVLLAAVFYDTYSRRKAGLG